MSVWPYFSRLETRALAQHFDEDVFDMSPSSHLYHLLEALSGEAGAADVVKQSLIARANESIETTWFRDLDDLFGDMLGLPRMPEESYDIDPENDLLTEQEMIEIELKDAWYRARLKDLLTGLQHGGTAEGFKFIARAITSVDADLYEAWRYRQRYDSVGRLTPLADRELIVVPQKQSISEQERRHFMLVADRLKPADSIVTMTTDGLAVHTVFDIKNAAADSSYFEIRKTVTQSINMKDIPPPEYLPEELHAGEKWLYYLQEGEKGEAPAAPFNTCQEFSQWYSVMPGSPSQIETASYLSKKDGKTSKETGWSIRFNTQSWSEWHTFPLADSPDNYPGGKQGRTPMSKPALTLQGEPYVFPERSQEDFARKLSTSIIANGGIVEGNRYKIKLSASSSIQKFIPSATISSSPPVPGILTASWFS